MVKVFRGEVLAELLDQVLDVTAQGAAHHDRPGGGHLKEFLQEGIDELQVGGSGLKVIEGNSPFHGATFLVIPCPKERGLTIVGHGLDLLASKVIEIFEGP
jgi:hypothetical protein